MFSSAGGTYGSTAMDPTDSRRVELFVRSLSPGAGRSPATTQLDRLRRLADDGTVDLSVSVWGREVGLSTTATRTDTGEFVLDRVAAFREWADTHDVCVETFFETREVESGLTGESYTALVLPVACLAEYRDDELVHVAPYTTDSAVHTVADRVTALEAAGGDSVTKERPAAVPSSTTDPLGTHHSGSRTTDPDQADSREGLRQ
jgi:hypothetical protein